MEKDVFSRLYGQDTSSAARKRNSFKQSRHRATKSCPLPDIAPAMMALSASPQISLDGDPNDPHTLLRGVFQFYCRFGRTGAHGTSETTMDNANFAKFCRECPQLVGGNFSTVDIDLIFVKVKAKGERRITYSTFLEALGVIATKKYPEMSLARALPMLLDSNISTLSCLDSATSPGKSVWRRRANLTDDQPADGNMQRSDEGNPFDGEVHQSNQTHETTKSISIQPPPAPFTTYTTDKRSDED